MYREQGVEGLCKLPVYCVLCTLQKLTGGGSGNGRGKAYVVRAKRNVNMNQKYYMLHTLEVLSTVLCILSVQKASFSIFAFLSFMTQKETIGIGIGDWRLEVYRYICRISHLLRPVSYLISIFLKAARLLILYIPYFIFHIQCSIFNRQASCKKGGYVKQ